MSLPDITEGEWAAQRELIKQCAELATDEEEYNNMGCNNTLIGNPPPASAPACAEFPDDNTAEPTSEEPYKIGSVQDCVLTRATLDADGKPILCEKNSDCQGGDVCGKVGFCCYTDSPTGECVNDGVNCALVETGQQSCANHMICQASQVCGKAEGDQVACFEQTSNPRCEEIVECEAQDELGNDTDHRSDPAELAPEPVQAADPGMFPHQIDDDLEEGDTETEIPDIDSDPCPNDKDTNGNCTAGQIHKWCSYEAPDMPEAVDVTDKEDRHSKASSEDASSEKTSSFDFDPNFNWIYDIKPGPLGIPKPNLGVSAGVTATAKMKNLFGGSGEKTAYLINIALSLRLGLDPETNLCGLTSKNPDGSDSVVQVLGLDFLPYLTHAAEYIGTTTKTLRRAFERGLVQALHPLPDGPWVFERKELDRVQNLFNGRRLRDPAGPTVEQLNLVIPTT